MHRCLEDMNNLVFLLEDNPAVVFDTSISEEEVNFTVSVSGYCIFFLKSTISKRT